MRALSLAPGIVPLGLVFGATAVEAGIPVSGAVLLSALVFAGGAQFATAALVATGASVLTVVGLVFLINARYFLLSTATIDLGRRAGAGPASRVALALGTVDESYALQAAWARAGAVPLAGLLAIPATLWVLWVAATVAGAFVGTRLPDLRPFGLDYILPGLFIGLLGIFADSPARLRAGVVAVVVEAALVLLGHGRLGLLLVPPALAFLYGHYARRETEVAAS